MWNKQEWTDKKHQETKVSMDIGKLYWSIKQRTKDYYQVTI